MGWIVAIVFVGLIVVAYRYTSVSVDLVILRQVADAKVAQDISMLLETNNIQFLQQHDDAKTIGHMISSPYVFKVEKSQFELSDQVLKENNL